MRAQAAEKARLERELRRNETLAAMGKLLAGVAHEVRNPLAGIRSTAQLWQRGIDLGAEGPDGLISEVDRLEAIVSRLLDFFRVGRGDLVPCDLGEIVRETSRCAEAEALAAKVKIELELVPYPPPVTMSPNAILQVTRNLVGNAIQATPPGGLIRLSTRVNAKTAMVEAAVEDEGAG